MAEGKAPLATGGGKTIPCSLRHGSDLREKNEVAPLAGGMIQPFWRPLSLKEGSLVVNSSQGGGTKDTWVIADG